MRLPKQTIKGTFEMKLGGIPLVCFWEKLSLRSGKGNEVTGRAIHFGPFVFGFTCTKHGRKKLSMADWRQRFHYEASSG